MIAAVQARICQHCWTGKMSCFCIASHTFQYLFTDLAEFERSDFVNMFLSDTSGFSSRLNRFVLLLKA